MKPFCTFCTEPLKEQDTFCIVACGHTFHQICVSNWLKLKNECPVCRKRANLSEIRKIFYTLDDTETAEKEGKPIANDLGAIINNQTVEINKLKEQLAVEKAKFNNSEEKIRELKATISIYKLELQLAKHRLRTEKFERKHWDILKENTNQKPNPFIPNLLIPVVPITQGSSMSLDRNNKLKNPNAPRRTMSSYTFFIQEKYKQAKYKPKELGEMWRQLVDKSKYQKLADDDMKRYQEEQLAHHSKDLTVIS